MVANFWHEVSTLFFFDEETRKNIEARIANINSMADAYAPVFSNVGNTERYIIIGETENTGCFKTCVLT